MSVEVCEMRKTTPATASAVPLLIIRVMSGHFIPLTSP
jgi:hypothetical protein